MCTQLWQDWQQYHRCWFERIWMKEKLSTVNETITRRLETTEESRAREHNVRV